MSLKLDKFVDFVQKNKDQIVVILDNDMVLCEPKDEDDDSDKFCKSTYENPEDVLAAILMGYGFEFENA